MIYQTSRVKSQKSKVKSSRQAGITLLLAILILSSILAISFSLAAVLFIEVRNSGDLLKTEPALYAATGVGEEALFNQERHACPDNGSECYTANFSNNVTVPNTPTVLASSTPIFVADVKAGSTFGSTLNNYYFCSSTGSAGCEYGKVTVKYLTTGSDAVSPTLYAYLCQFDPNDTNYSGAPCTATGPPPEGYDSYWTTPAGGANNLDGSSSMMPSPGNSSESWTLTPGLQQQLILTNPGASDIYVQIETFADQAGTIAKGLPYVGKTAVNISTLNGSVGRKIMVTVPNSSGSSGSSGGSATGYAHHRLITVNGPIPSAQQNFPVLINITDPTIEASLKSSVVSPQGYDIVFAKNSDGSGYLNSEIENYNNGTGALAAWVNVDSGNFPLGLTNGTQFYMFYGKSGISSHPNASSAVWDGNYKGVWHLGESANPYNDSTSNGFNSTSGTYPTHTFSGQIDGAQTFNGSSNYIGFPSAPNIANSSFTLSAWAKRSATGVWSMIYTQGTASTNFGLQLGWNVTDNLLFGFWTDDLNSVGTYTDSNWHYLVGTYNSNTGSQAIYLDGSFLINRTASSNYQGSGGAIIGQFTEVPGYFFPGSIDEVRVSSIVRSADWIATEYNNQSNPSAFVTVGP